MGKRKKQRKKATSVARILLWATLTGFALVSCALAGALAKAWIPLGALPSGARLDRMERSKRFVDGRFVDIMPRREPNMLEILPKWLEGGAPHRRPARPVPYKALSRKDFATPPSSGLRITWLGHSTLIIEISGKRVLVDPVWGDFVAPLAMDSLRRFIPPPLPLTELPRIDLVVISHDHYDHLDYPTIASFAQAEMPFYVPLGVGAHLEYWGISPERIREHQWWGESIFDEDLTLVCTPARHFSGRFLVDKDKTLWSGWALLGRDKRVYYSGDTAMFPELTKIGKRYGPFDATMIETGAYNQLWTDVHLGPEQAVLAHQMVQGDLMIPVHWGMFDLGLHGWTEPIERTLIAAHKSGVRVTTLRPGESVEPSLPITQDRWWPELPFRSAEEDPIVSSGLPARLF